MKAGLAPFDELPVQVGQKTLVQSLVGISQLPFYLQCLKSLIQFGEGKFDLLLHTDGTITEKHENLIFSELEEARVTICDSNQNRERILDLLKGRPQSQKIRKESIWGIEFFDPLFANPEDPISFYLDADILFLRNFKGVAQSSNPLNLMNLTNSELTDLAIEGGYASSIGEFVQSNQSSVLSTTSAILSKATTVSGSDVFKALDRIKQLKTYVQCLAGPESLFIFPTLAPLYTISQLLEKPVELNSNIGHYSYFANILDMSALSVPTGFYANGMPFGVTLMGLPFRDSFLAQFAVSVLGIDDLSLGLSRS